MMWSQIFTHIQRNMFYMDRYSVKVTFIKEYGCMSQNLQVNLM